MSKLHFKRVPLYYLAPIFLLSMLALGSCTQGQGPSGGEPVEVTAGTETPPVDVCEKPENLNNILCQWVATELTTSGSSGESKSQFTYDEKGRVTNSVTYEDGKKNSFYDVSYNDYGLWKYHSYGNPDPKGSENFTYENIQTIDYNNDGTIHLITNEYIYKGVKTSKEDQYTYAVGNQVVIATINKDSGGNITSDASQQIIQKDPSSGKTSSIDTRKGLLFNLQVNPLHINPVNTWEIQNFSFNADSGRLESWETKSQDCNLSQQYKQVPCDLVNIAPTSAQKLGIEYDDLGRLQKLTLSADGDTNKSPPTFYDGTTDRSMECQMKYDLQTQAKLAYQNPLEISMMVSPSFGFNMDFSDKDIFTSFSCGNSGSPPEMTMTVKWVRLWEALPEGKAPGS